MYQIINIAILNSYIDYFFIVIYNTVNGICLGGRFKLNISYFLTDLEDISTIIYILKIFFISICTYYTFFKVLNSKNYVNFKIPIVLFITSFISIICGIIKTTYGSFSVIICLIVLLSILYATITKNKFGYTLLITIISLSINYVIFFISVTISFIPNVLFEISNDYINLLLITLFHSVILNFLFKIRRFKDGFSFLQNNINNEYFDILILNVSAVILFLVIIANNFNFLLTTSILLTLIIFSILIFITIQKTLTMYYKHKLLVTELNQTKSELENKNKEIAELEAENLKISKTSHSIAHKQKSLEYKLNQLMLKSEASEELDISDRIKNISNQCFKETNLPELSKTNVEEIDDMFAYMQSECIKNNIKFELQIIGNIYHIINNFISKEDLEILIADHLKNAIIAINHSDNVNRSILVRLGIIDRFYSLYIYDSGIEFEIETLSNLGKIPSTTHANDGGTGMGFMNTFDTLRKYEASLCINEIGEPSKDNYTKALIFKFDKKQSFNICSYRFEEILSKYPTMNDVIISKIN